MSGSRNRRSLRCRNSATAALGSYCDVPEPFRATSKREFMESSERQERLSSAMVLWWEIIRSTCIECGERTDIAPSSIRNVPENKKKVFRFNKVKVQQLLSNLLSVEASAANDLLSCNLHLQVESWRRREHPNIRTHRRWTIQLHLETVVQRGYFLGSKEKKQNCN